MVLVGFHGKFDYAAAIISRFYFKIHVNKYVIPNKVKETHFKIIHRYFPCNDFISKFKEGFSPYAVYFSVLIY